MTVAVTGAAALSVAFEGAIARGEVFGSYERYEAVFEEIGRSIPGALSAWHALERLWEETIPSLSSDRSLRQRGRHLLTPLKRVLSSHPAKEPLSRLLAVLDDEVVVVLDVEDVLGFRGRMSGIVENHQLQVLLMDVFPGYQAPPDRLVSAEAAALARGIGPRQSAEIVCGVWNLYHWQALDERGMLPDHENPSDKGLWIWEDETPADIPCFEGERVILLGPPSYARNWRSERAFELLTADLVIDEVFTRSEAEDWLDRLVNKQ